MYIYPQEEHIIDNRLSLLHFPLLRPRPVLVEHRLVTDRRTDGQTDRQTDGHMMTAYIALA